MSCRFRIIFSCFFWLTCLCGIFLAQPVFGQLTVRQSSQKKPRQPNSPQTPVQLPNPNVPSLRREPPGKEVPGVVYIHQKIDMRSSQEPLMTLDGEPAPSLILKNVTLGLVADKEGHIVTRLVGVSPSNPPLEVLVLGQGFNKQYTAKFLGIDSVTGLCVLKVEGSNFLPPSFAEANLLPAQLPVKVRGFHPQQGQSQNPMMTVMRPRIYSFDGLAVKATNDFRFTVHHPLYQLDAPQLTPVQDCSLIFTGESALFGIAVYDTNSEGQSIVYPAARVLNIVAKVVKSNESLAYGWLGATPDLNMAAPIQSTQNLKTKPELGVRVRDVLPDSPAEQAGIKSKDILLSINERRVESNAQLTTALRQLPADSEVVIRLKRENEYKVVKARLVPSPALESNQIIPALVNQLEKMKSELNALPANDPERTIKQGKVETLDSVIKGIVQPAPPEVKLRVFYGFEAQPLSAQLLAHFSVPQGVLVASVAGGGRAAQGGLQAGDIIVKVGDKAIHDLGALLQTLDETKEPAVLTVQRRQDSLTIKVPR